MSRHKDKYPGRLAGWELWLLVAMVAACVGLACAGKGRKEREAYRGFLQAAPRVAAALEAFARDHGGRFPPDAMFVRRPDGLSDKYINWRPSWKIDYEVHPNGRGGEFVCLEFGGPFKHRQYFALCRKPWVRARYGRGEPIPGHTNRIWLVRERAAIMPKTSE